MSQDAYFSETVRLTLQKCMQPHKGCQRLYNTAFKAEYSAGYPIILY